MPKRSMVLDGLDNAQGSIYISRFDSGLNTVESNELIDDAQAIIRKNWGQEAKGALKKVNGYTQKNAITLGAASIRGLFRTYQSASSRQLLAICNGLLYYSTDGGTTFTAEVGSVALTAADFFTGINYNDLFFITGPTDNLKLYTPGTNTLSTPASVPTDPCKILLKRADRRMIALVNSVNGSTLYASKVDPTGAAGDDWSATADSCSIAIDGAKSEPLSGGLTFGAVDIIFKNYAAFRVAGYPNPQAQRMAGSPGCAAPYSCAQGAGLGFFLGHDAVWMFDGNRFIRLTDQIRDIIESINSSYVQNAFGIVRNSLYWLFYTPSGQTTNTKCLIYDIRYSNPYSGKNIWYERDNLAMNCPVYFDGIADSGELYAGDSASTGFVYRLDFSSSGDDNGSNIDAIYQTKYFNANLPHVVKRFPKIHIRYFLSSGSIICTWYTDGGATVGSFTLSPSQVGTPLGSFVLDVDRLAGNTETTHTERLPDTAVGKDISLKFRHVGSGTSPIIRNCEIEWEALYVP